MRTKAAKRQMEDSDAAEALVLLAHTVHAHKLDIGEFI